MPRLPNQDDVAHTRDVQALFRILHRVQASKRSSKEKDALVTPLKKILSILLETEARAS